MTEKRLDVVNKEMKGILAKGIEEALEVVRRVSQNLIASSLEQSSKNVDDLIKIYGHRLKEKVNPNGTETNKED